MVKLYKRFNSHGHVCKKQQRTTVVVSLMNGYSNNNTTNNNNQRTRWSSYINVFTVMVTCVKKQQRATVVVSLINACFVDEIIQLFCLPLPTPL